MPRSLLDTDILSEYLKGHDEAVASRAAEYARQHGIFTFTSVTVHGLDDVDARFILEGLHRTSDSWLNVNRTTTDEDEQADYGNDWIFLDGRRERIERILVEAFGERATRFYHYQPRPQPTNK